MAERNGASNGFWWLLIGYLLGVATTIGAILFLNRSEPPRPPERVTIAPPPAAAPPAKPVKLPSAAPAAVQERAAPDEQVAEDAAAAGMTSRTKRPDEQ